MTRKCRACGKHPATDFAGRLCAVCVREGWDDRHGPCPQCRTYARRWLLTEGTLCRNGHFESAHANGADKPSEGWLFSGRPRKTHRDTPDRELKWNEEG